VVCDRSAAADITRRLRLGISPQEALRDESGFAGITGERDGALTFAAKHFPAPLLLAHSGPSGTIRSSADGSVEGSLHPQSGAAVVISDAEIRDAIADASDLDELVNVFDTERFDGVVIAFATRCPV
jgi:hypothetical protein